MKLRILPLVAGLAMLLAILAGCASVSTPSGASDPQGARLAQAYHILAKCDQDYDGHISKAMDMTEKAAKMLGVDVHADGIEDKKDGDCIDHLRTAQEMIRIAHSGLPVTGEKKALVTIGVALREVTAALNSAKK
jgi:hypothetical protein